MPHCSVIGCSESSGKDDNRERNIFFHRFPNPERSPKRLKIWIDYCQRHQFKPSKHARVCSKHFTDSDFDSSQLLKIRLMPKANFQGPKLLPDTVPSVPAEVWSASETSEAEELKESISQNLDQSIDSRLENQISSDDQGSNSLKEESDNSDMLPSSHFIAVDQLSDSNDSTPASQFLQIVQLSEESNDSTSASQFVQVVQLSEGSNDSSDDENTRFVQCELGSETFRHSPWDTATSEVSTTTVESNANSRKRKAIFQLFSTSNAQSLPASKRRGLSGQENTTGPS